jgi:hypothetical protein
MPSLPACARVLFAGYRESRESALLRTEMEDGPPKQARVRSRVLVTRAATLQFLSLADYRAFLAWYRDELHEGAAWFDFRDPVSGETVEARFAGGGFEAAPLQPGPRVWQLTARIETWS